MNVADSSTWLEYFADGPNAGRFAPAIEDVGRLIVPSICLLEVFKRVLQQRGEQEALQAIALMQLGTVGDLTADLSISCRPSQFRPETAYSRQCCSRHVAKARSGALDSGLRL